MRTTESVTLAAAPSTVFPYVADLAEYPAWLPLVHQAATSTDGDSQPAWDVEIRARVGPFARSKRLRMRRTQLVPDELAVFERDEIDGRQHAGWTLRVELLPVLDHGTTVTMHLAYDGSLWTGGLLARVLDDQIRQGRSGLAALVDDEPAP
jgi:uncharacterized protein YndB with AHSA1/START domain